MFTWTGRMRTKDWKQSPKSWILEDQTTHCSSVPHSSVMLMEGSMLLLIQALKYQQTSSFFMDGKMED